MRIRTPFLWTMILSLAIAAAMGIAAVLLEELGATAERVFVTSLLVGAYSMICLLCAFVIDRGLARPLMWTGIVTSFIALGVWLVLVWGESWRWENVWEKLLIKSGVTLTIVCIGAAHFGLLAMLPLPRAAWRAVRGGTWGLAGLLGLTILIAIWPEVEEDWMWKTIAILSILTACGTIVTPVLALIGRIQKQEEPSTLEENVRVSLRCPRCGRTQQIRPGRAMCAACNLRFELKIEEPRCACGYLLYGLDGDACPECGRKIPEKERWPAAASGGVDQP